MTQFEIAKLACRIMALWLFAEAITYVATGLVQLVAVLTTTFHSAADLMQLFAGSGLELVLYGGTGLLLWALSGKLAEKMAGASKGPITGDAITNRTALQIACAAVGMFAFINVARSIGYDVAALLRERWVGGYDASTWVPRIGSELIGLALALWLMLGSRGVARAIHWARTAGDKSQGDARRCSRCGYILHDEATRCSECGAEAVPPALPAE